MRLYVLQLLVFELMVWSRWAMGEFGQSPWKSPLLQTLLYVLLGVFVPLGLGVTMEVSCSLSQIQYLCLPAWGPAAGLPLVVLLWTGWRTTVELSSSPIDTPVASLGCLWGHKGRRGGAGESTAGAAVVLPGVLLPQPESQALPGKRHPNSHSGWVKGEEGRGRGGNRRRCSRPAGRFAACWPGVPTDVSAA